MKQNRRPSELGRCTACRRLTTKDSLKPGPEGGWYGPDCLPAAIQAARTSPFAVQNREDPDVED